MNTESQNRNKVTDRENQWLPTGREKGERGKRYRTKYKLLSTKQDTRI